MEKKKITDEKETATEIVPINPLELRVTKNVVGVFETNIEQLEAYVTKKLEEYNPESYFGDADMAKKDRAELNNAKKVLSQARINLMRELMKPYSDFETRCKNLEKMIDGASGKLDEIVKVRDEEERTKKKIRIIEIWNSRNFTLFPVEKIFNPKWLNKTCKESEIIAEIDAGIAKVYDDLKKIEKYAEPCDVDTVKSYYLDCLDIGESLDYGEQLVKNRKIVQQEAAEREEREHNEIVEQQRKEEYRENINREHNENLADLASVALDLPKESEQKKTVYKEYTVTISATEEQVNRLKSAMTALGIAYKGFVELIF